MKRAPIAVTPRYEALTRKLGAELGQAVLRHPGLLLGFNALLNACARTLGKSKNELFPHWAAWDTAETEAVLGQEVRDLLEPL